MSSNKCAKCDQTVYPVEGLRCLDKMWHKGCFKCHECNMTLNLKNYKGFEKRPYCNAHCPQAKATTVADTPEIRRLAENTRIQSQAKYHEDFEKSKGKGFTAIVDDPEMRRIKETSKIISNAAYHGDLAKKKQMEERRGISGQADDLPMIRTNSNSSNNNNNNSKHQQNRMQILNNHHHNQSQPIDNSDYSPNHQTKFSMNQAQQLQQRQVQQQLQQQQQQLIHKQQQQQQLLLKQQQQQQEYIQNHNGQTNFINRNSGQFDHHLPRQQQQQQQHYPLSPQQQQQLLIRQQQQQQQQQQHIIRQQQRQSLDPGMQPMVRQPSKQAIINSGGGGHPQHLIKHQPIINNIQAQAHQQQHPMIKYVPMSDAIGQAQVLPPHLIGVAPSTGHMLDPPVSSGPMQNGQRVSGPALIGVSPQAPSHHHPNQQQQQQQQHMIYNSHQMNGIVPTKQHQMHLVGIQQQQHHHHHQIVHNPNQMDSQQMRPNPGQHPMQAPPIQQTPRRAFRAMYDYAANDVDEVSFYENDILIDCVNVDRNWLIGRVARTGQTGMLPANYVNELPSQ